MEYLGGVENGEIHNKYYQLVHIIFVFILRGSGSGSCSDEIRFRELAQSLRHEVVQLG